jgi:hypothetical protein
MQANQNATMLEDLCSPSAGITTLNTVVPTIAINATIIARMIFLIVSETLQMHMAIATLELRNQLLHIHIHGQQRQILGTVMILCLVQLMIVLTIVRPATSMMLLDQDNILYVPEIGRVAYPLEETPSQVVDTMSWRSSARILAISAMIRAVGSL